MAEAKSYQDAAAEMERHMQFVAERIGFDWKRLGRELKIVNYVIDGIDADFKRTEEKAFQVLLKWSQACGQTIATIEFLIEALRRIGKTSIAEELEHKIGWQSKNLLCRCPITESCGNQTSNAEESRNIVLVVPPEDPVKKIDKELKQMLKICIDNLTICDCPTLILHYKMVQHVLKLNTELLKLIDSHQYSNDDVTAVEEIKTSCRIRCIQADQTLRLIQQMCSDPRMNKVAKRKKGKSKALKHRSFSATLPRCTSLVNLETRSNTYSSTPNKSDISSPIYTSKLNLLNMETTPALQPKHDRVREEQPRETEQAEVSRKVSQSIARCESCGKCMSNLNAENPDSAGNASEHHQQSLPLDQNCNQKPAPDDADKESKTTKL